MILYKTTNRHTAIDQQKKQGTVIGFVPTMGALHSGHLSLIRASRQQNDITVCSIFVNPTQFNDITDFHKYPVTIESDILQLTKANTDIFFLPSVDEMYPPARNLHIIIELGSLESVFEGEYRPGHFQGVCQVVHRLFSIVMPHTCLFWSERLSAMHGYQKADGN